MLAISSDKIAEVIILARELHRAENEFDGFVGQLTGEEKVALVSVFWIGRGSFDASELAEAQQTAAREATTPTASYLKGSPHLADHLESGMEALGLNPTDAEEDLL
ncbi:DUF3775 domain-containing protein [Yoonia sp. I 8.24]|uniref:DUF3775 domain-containing protein n=1 Tax=Yoonia sp. I 8.24 TaxID=1537229 RepID=UPI001EDD64A6|nr:DUF3775 domain-containing protein [Yoonia sp. I 8.24]MCG3269176.1 DUF3775 domain-containing protein [Yoonia sp. I 8.24]